MEADHSVDLGKFIRIDIVIKDLESLPQILEMCALKADIFRGSIQVCIVEGAKFAVEHLLWCVAVCRSVL